MTEDNPSPRNHLFLSHATPEDNEFTRWLAGKLTLAGYHVWYDLARLKGGDYFWNKIEHAIRNDCIRMIAIVSHASHKKDGVRNEWDFGVTLERQIPGFVIPVRIDDFDFSQLPITLHRKNVIDFYSGWHLGLAQLFDTLENTKIEKAEPSNPSLARAWLPSLTDGAINWLDQQETLESNWVQILALPLAIETTQILGGERRIPSTSTNRNLPWFELGDKIVGFAPTAGLVDLFKETVMLQASTAVDTETFITDGVTWGENRVKPPDARYQVATLVRRAWDLKMESLGLKPYELSNGRFAWYVPSGLLPKDKAEFVEANGKKRKKQLAGTSAKYKVRWHYAVSMHAVLEGTRRMELRAHIVFTDVEGRLIESTARMHQLRRSFCKNWWNDRWRGFLRAFLAFVAEGADAIKLPVGGERSIKISSLPITFSAPRGLSDLQELNEDEDISLEESAGNDPNEDILTEDEEDVR